MITENERQEIIEAAVEKALLILPEVVGNLMATNAAMSKLNKDFYEKYPEFKKHKDSVMSVIEMIEGRDPTIDYKDILDKAVPEIKSRIVQMGKLDITNVQKSPRRQFEDVDFKSLDSHGDL